MSCRYMNVTLPTDLYFNSKKSLSMGMIFVMVILMILFVVFITLVVIYMPQPVDAVITIPIMSRRKLIDKESI